jgi:ABC-2 type transport system ATP-binding protein
MCDRVLVLEKGVLGFDGPVDAGIKFLHYDDNEDDVASESSEDDTDDELGADV